jgi:hypothetical protein
MQIPIVTETRRLSAHGTQRELRGVSLRLVRPSGAQRVPERALLGRPRLASPR